MFSREYQFKYSDLDNKGNIKLSTIVDLLQDVSIYHSAVVGYNLKKMRDMHLAMLLHGWRIKLYEPLRHDMPATFNTGITKIQRCDVIRKYEIIQEGRVKGIATADWFSFDTEKKSIIRVPEEINSTYESVDEEDNNFPLVKVRPCSDPVEIAQTFVTKRDLDTNDHMNNVKSVEVALDYLSDDINISELQVIYNKELRKDDIIHVFVKDDEEGFTVELHNGEGYPCVIVRTV